MSNAATQASSRMSNEISSNVGNNANFPAQSCQVEIAHIRHYKALNNSTADGLVERELRFWEANNFSNKFDLVMQKLMYMTSQGSQPGSHEE